MNRHTAPIPLYPTVVVQLHDDGSAHVDVAGRETTFPAGDPDRTRRDVLAHATGVAQLLGRAVRMSVQEPAATYQLAVRPDGTATELSATPTRPAKPTAAPPPVTPPKDSSAAGRIPTADRAPGPPTPAAMPVRARPTLRLTFNTQPPVLVSRNAALGRNPDPIGGREPIAVATPARMLSRTHALVDVDTSGRILVTDHHSSNGIEIPATPPRVLEPNVPYVIEPGTPLLMGDVECVITLI